MDHTLASNIESSSLILSQMNYIKENRHVMQSQVEAKGDVLIKQLMFSHQLRRKREEPYTMNYNSECYIKL